MDESIDERSLGGLPQVSKLGEKRKAKREKKKEKKSMERPGRAFEWDGMGRFVHFPICGDVGGDYVPALMRDED